MEYGFEGLLYICVVLLVRYSHQDLFYYYLIISDQKINLSVITSLSHLSCPRYSNYWTEAIDYLLESCIVKYFTTIIKNNFF